VKNKLTDLRDHLFAAIEDLRDSDKSPEELERDLKRAHAIAALGSVLVGTAKVEVAFIKATDGRKGSNFLPELDEEEPRPLTGGGQQKQVRGLAR